MEREVYNPETGQYELVYDDGIYENEMGGEGSAPVAAAPVAPQPDNRPPPGNNQWGISIPSENPAGGGMDRDLAYWMQNGVSPTGNDQSIFDANGQVRPGWRRTARGYERTGGGPTGGPTGGPVGAPTSGPSGGPTGGPSYNLGGGSFDSSGFAWPQYSAPRYTPTAAFEAPPAFSYGSFDYQPFSHDAFKAPEFNDVFNDGSYKGRRDEGLQAIEHGAAAKGLSRLPSTLKALAGWNQDFASREYGNVFDRAGQTYSTNRNNAFGNWNANRDNAFGNWQANRNNAADAYSLNYGVSRDVWDRGEQQNLNSFDRNSKASFDEFDFNQFRPADRTFSDLYNRWKAELDANTTIASAGANG